MKYKFFQWWISFGIKPKSFKIFRYVTVPMAFLGLVVFVAVIISKLWIYCLSVLLPLVLIDLIWDAFNYKNHNKKRVVFEHAEHNQQLAASNKE